MSWIVRNKLRGTLELHGFLPGGQPVRIPGGEIFDLDTLPVKREVLNASRQLQVALKENYLETELCKEDRSDVETLDSYPTSSGLSRWQTGIQGQLNVQARKLEDVSSVLETLVDKISSWNQPPAGAGNVSLDAEALRGILKDETKNQAEVFQRLLKQDIDEEVYLTEAEASNRVRVIEEQIQGMAVESEGGGNQGVVSIDSKANNDEKINLLSDLGGLDG